MVAYTLGMPGYVQYGTIVLALSDIDCAYSANVIS
jgi:hypothetical protein